MGLYNPIITAIILGIYKDNKQASMLGYATLFMNIGGLILQTLGGVLGDIGGWQMVFFAHMFGVIAFVMAFFLPEPEIKAEHKKEKGKLSRVLIPIFIILVVFQILNYPAMLNLSTVLADRGLGGATMAAMGLNVYTIIGAVTGAVFGTLFKHAKRLCISFGMIAAAIGILCIYFGYNMVVICIGTGLLGFGFCTFTPTFMSWMGLATQPKMIATSTSIVNIGIQLGGFIATFWLQFLNIAFGDSVYLPMIIEAIFCIAVAVIFLVFNPFKAGRYGNKDGEVPVDTGSGPGDVGAVIEE